MFITLLIAPQIETTQADIKSNLSITQTHPYLFPVPELITTMANPKQGGDLFDMAKDGTKSKHDRHPIRTHLSTHVTDLARSSQGRRQAADDSIGGRSGGQGRRN